MVYLLIGVAAVSALLSATISYDLGKSRGVDSMQKFVKQAERDRDEARVLTTKTITEFNDFKLEQARMLTRAEEVAAKAREDTLKSEKIYSATVQGINAQYLKELSVWRSSNDQKCNVSKITVDALNRIVQEANK